MELEGSRSISEINEVGENQKNEESQSEEAPKEDLKNSKENLKLKGMIPMQLSI